MRDASKTRASSTACSEIFAILLVPRTPEPFCAVPEPRLERIQHAPGRATHVVGGCNQIRYHDHSHAGRERCARSRLRIFEHDATCGMSLDPLGCQPVQI